MTDLDALVAELRATVKAASVLANIAPDLARASVRLDELNRALHADAAAVKQEQRTRARREIFLHLRDSQHYKAALEVERVFLRPDRNTDRT